MPRNAEAILDEYLVLQAMESQPEAWRQLVEAWHPLLVRRASRLLLDPHAAADAVQDTWISVARSLSGLEDPARFAPWLYRILARRCADYVDRDRRTTGRSDGEIREAVSGPCAHGREDSAAIRDAMRQLPPSQRVLLTLRYADEIPVRVISEILGIAEGTVKSRLHTAREALRSIIESRDPEDTRDTARR